MELRRYLLFFVVAMASYLLYWQVVIPRTHPELLKSPVKSQIKKDAEKQGLVNSTREDGEKGDSETASKPKTETQVSGADSEGGDSDGVSGGDDAKIQFPEHPTRTVTIGSLDPESGFFLQATIDSRGASVARVELNDPRYRDLNDKSKPLAVVSKLNNNVLQTMQTRLPGLEEELLKYNVSISEVNWKFAGKKQEEDAESVTFEYEIPTSELVLKKTYSVETGNNKERDEQAEPYKVQYSFTVANKGESAQKLSYVMVGPVGLPLENVENTRRFMDLQFGILDANGSVNHVQSTAGEIAKQYERKARHNDDSRVETYQGNFRYAGVDVQYFSALLAPTENQNETPYIEKITPIVSVKDESARDRSRITMLIESKPVDVAPGKSVTHSYALYVGPKRDSLLVALDASETIEFGWFGIIAKPMLALLKFFHTTLYLPYGLAIIMLTVMVRGSMYPLSRKQALGAKKMKELAPKMKELQKKHEGDKEKLARAQMELFSKHGYNPLSGCLPILLQFPIFIGLYQALNNAVDLRMAPFLWADNLAAPDALFPLPFTIPFLGWTEFNLLPMLTICLFIVQQKLFMPPATSPEQELQFKMMNYMMIFMGVMFYRVPAGLCVYFIASSLWGIVERKMLDLHKDEPTTAADEESPPTAEPKKTTAKPDEPTKPQVNPDGFWGKVLSAVDVAANPHEKKGKALTSNKANKKSKKK